MGYYKKHSSKGFIEIDSNIPYFTHRWFGIVNLKIGLFLFYNTRCKKHSLMLIAESIVFSDIYVINTYCNSILCIQIGNRIENIITVLSLYNKKWGLYFCFSYLRMHQKIVRNSVGIWWSRAGCKSLKQYKVVIKYIIKEKHISYHRVLSSIPKPVVPLCLSFYA